MKLHHYYHLYAGGMWQVPVEEHIAALNKSGLINSLDFMGIGLVGSEDNRKRAKIELTASLGSTLNWKIVAEENAGFEQVSQSTIDLSEPAKILYAHTKGAANHRHDQDNWRREMTAGTIYHWRECVDLLDKYDAVGCRFRKDPFRHYSGTFWWATSDYLRTLAPISYVYRDDAEAWIGQSLRGGSHAEIDPYHPDFKIAVHSFGRTFVCKRDKFGHSYSNEYEVGPPQLGDEFVNFPSTEGTKIISHLMANGATFSIKGNTILVESVKE